MKIATSFFLFFFLINSAFITAHNKKAFCAVPIADCCCHSLTILFENDDCVERYENLPLSGQTGRYACPRDQQILLHEQVTIIDELNDEVQIEVPNLFYIDPDFPIIKKNSFWTLKKNLILFDELSGNGINPEEFLPHSLNAQNKLLYDSCVATLMFPFYDCVTQQTISAGTRFLIADQTETTLTLWVFDAQDTQFKQIAIDRALCYLNIEKSTSERLHDFIALLQLWAHNSNGFIPFVWGGSSVREFLSKDEFYEHDEYRELYPISYWVRESCTTQPYAGFDASSLVFRSAQIVGIPYFCKNTKTARAYLKEFGKEDTLQEGDLIWLPGGLVVISDISTHKVIAARGYQTGYGKVLECSLAEFFKNINTYDELLTAYIHKTPLECCTKDNIVTTVFDDWVILKLPI